MSCSSRDGPTVGLIFAINGLLHSGQYCVCLVPFIVALQAVSCEGNNSMVIHQTVKLDDRIGSAEEIPVPSRLQEPFTDKY